MNTKILRQRLEKYSKIHSSDRQYVHDESEDMKIAIGLVFYNKKLEIERLLSTIDKKGIDYILAIDGQYPFLYDLARKRDPFFSCPLSTDGSRELLTEFGEQQRKKYGMGGIKVIIDNCVANEFTKRNRYLELCDYLQINYLLIVDSDEYFDQSQTNWNLFRNDFKEKVFKNEGKNVYNVKTITDLYGRTADYPRAWYNPFEMKYHRYSHYKFFNYAKNEQIDNVLDCQYACDILDHIVLKHDHELRSDHDMQDRSIYEDYLVRYEELINMDVDPRSADIIARKMPATHKDSCICLKCIKFKNIDLDKIIDPRPHDQREKDPFAQLRNENNNIKNE
jgi:hypothetical protein